MLSKTLSVSKRFNSLPDLASTLGEFCQLLFTLIVPHVDDYGRMTADPFSVKMTVMPASSRPLPEFIAALHALHDSELLTVYQTTDDIWLQVNKFEEHQRGLSKRTESKIPEPSGNSREFPGNLGNYSLARARGTELNRTELNLTEGNRTEPKIPDSDNKLVRNVVAANKSKHGINGNGHHGDGRSKRPVFTGERLVVHEFMLSDCMSTLREHTDDFDLHSWFFDLDAMAVRKGLVIPKRDNGAWLQSQLVAEAQRRGLPLTMARPIEEVAGKQTRRLMQAMVNIKREA